MERNATWRAGIRHYSDRHTLGPGRDCRASFLTSQESFRHQGGYNTPIPLHSVTRATATTLLHRTERPSPAVEPCLCEHIVGSCCSSLSLLALPAPSSTSNPINNWRCSKPA